MISRLPSAFLACVISSFVVFTSCKPEDDTTDPVIFLKGDNPYALDSIGSTSFQEPGFTAVDETDGDISNRVMVQYPSIATDSAKTYQAVYTVMDEAGNSFKTYRLISVRNSIAFMEGVYSHDTLNCDNTKTVFQNIISGSPIINRDFTISNFAGKGQQAKITGRIDFSDNLSFDLPVSLLDSDSTVITSVSFSSLVRTPLRIAIDFYAQCDTVPVSVKCGLVMMR